MMMDTPGDANTAPWWQHAVLYQVYPRSFADSNDDGIGDIAGIRSRLGYLADLGVDGIWVSPWFVSPFRDGGYDVADYRDIDPRLGTLDDARALIAEAGQLGLRVLFDLVPNHTSSEHPWFKAALAAGPGSAERARYHFHPGDSTGRPPNNWRSVFGGPAWTRVEDGEWYLHLFDPSQPDLNWANPEVRKEFESIIRFWIDLGAAGFRTDVAHGLVKHPDYADLIDASVDGDHPYWDRDGVHEVIREWRRLLDSYPGDPMMVAEAWPESLDRHVLYQRPDEFHQAFNFFFLLAKWDHDSMTKVIEESIATTVTVGSRPTWVLSNHDVVRHATRLGLDPDVDPESWLLDADISRLDPAAGLRRARAATLLALALPGSAYLYQGEELGLPEVYDLPFDVLDDPIWERSGHTSKGRDGCRVPIPWTRQPPAFGFGDEPWLPMPPEWGEVSVEAQTGVAGSTLEMYRTALAARRAFAASDGLEWVEMGGSALAFRRGTTISVTNFGSDKIQLPAGTLIVASGPVEADGIPPETTVWVASG